MRRQYGIGRPFQPSVRAAAYEAKARRRERARHCREQFYRPFAVWICQRMQITRAEIEWRVTVLTAPDTRSLTGKLMGDPHPLRSCLHAREQGWI